MSKQCVYFANNNNKGYTIVFLLSRDKGSSANLFAVWLACGYNSLLPDLRHRLLIIY